MPFRRLFRWATHLPAFALALGVAIASGRVPEMPPTPAAACPESGGCPRCPASERRAADSCATCPQLTLAVATRRVRVARPAGRREPASTSGIAADGAFAPRRAALRHRVLGASPPTHLLLATFRN